MLVSKGDPDSDPLPLHTRVRTGVFSHTDIRVPVVAEVRGEVA